MERIGMARYLAPIIKGPKKRHVLDRTEHVESQGEKSAGTALLRSGGVPGPGQVHPALVGCATTAEPGLAGAGAPRAFEAALGDGVGDGGEDFGHVGAGLGAGLEEEQALLLGVRLGFGRRDLPRVSARVLVVVVVVVVVVVGDAGAIAAVPGTCTATRAALVAQVDFVSHQGDDDARRRLPLELGHPVLRLGHRRRLRQVIHHQGRLRVAIVHRSERRKPLLACGVPDLELDRPVGKSAFLSQEGRCRPQGGVSIAFRMQGTLDGTLLLEDVRAGVCMPPIVGSLFS